MYELSMTKLILSNSLFISKLDKNICGIVLYCSVNPNDYLSFMEQYELLTKIKEYYLNSVIYPGLEETTNLWDGILFNNERLSTFWEEYVEDVEVQMEHIEPTETNVQWDLSGLLSL